MARKLKAVLFNDKTEAPLLQYADSLPNFSAYVKQKLREDADPSSLVSPEIERLIADMVKKQITLCFGE